MTDPRRVIGSDGQPALRVSLFHEPCSRMCRPDDDVHYFIPDQSGEPAGPLPDTWTDLGAVTDGE